MKSFHHLKMLEDLYEQYKKDPSQLDPSWRYFFEGWELGKGMTPQVSEVSRVVDVAGLIDAYRTHGHLLASFNPLAEGSPPPPPPELDLKTYGLSLSDLETEVSTEGCLPEPTASLRALIGALQKTYCNKIGFECMGLGSLPLEQWIQKQIEPFQETAFSPDEEKQILHDLNRSEMFESFLHTRYAGQKRFSLEGGETLIPMMNSIINQADTLGVIDVVIGMAHRGRLNVLANILGKSYSHIFHEFEDHYAPNLTAGTGDVKYHKGHVVGFKKETGVEHTITLCANPSHLESVDPVVEGGARAMQLKGKTAAQILPILIHGDASVAGQGIVYETMQLGRLRGYSTGGTLHIVINNQIGFTTCPTEGRSTRYCTDIAKTFGAPVFHVNAEDPEGCVFAAKLALQIRQQFGCDVFIDLNCYRKYGHNEGDEPAFTQPAETRIIKAKKSIRELYLQELLQKGVLSSQEAAAQEEAFKQSLYAAQEQAKLPTAQIYPPKPQKTLPKQELSTAVNIQELKALAVELSTVPEGFTINPKIKRLLQDRVASFDQPKDKLSIDWATAETLAYATLLKQGVHVRISGQDVRRGTFSHRHAMLVDQAREAKYFPLSHLKGTKALFDVYNSPLSEFAVLGFEFGYSLIVPEALVIWEAQYGDFANGAQVMTDQYIAASEQKWGFESPIVLFLPHGYEGAGPEHSSGRIERFLQLAAEGNLRIANVTTPAQLFHLLRRQAMATVKKPLVLFTPKALLRHPLVLSSQLEFEEGGFQNVLDDPTKPASTKTLVFCSGKVYYDLYAEREKRGKKEEVALVRVELLHPFDVKAIQTIVGTYSGCSNVLWVQEEPANMGPYQYIEPLLRQKIPNLGYAGRDASASTAAGSLALHKKQYQAMMDQVFQGESK